jgi:hemerythrin
MDWIAWDHTLDTGHARMDADHKELAALFNLLRDTVEGGKGTSACARVLDDIIRHAKAHFEIEQRLMTQHRYPKTDQHAAEHAMLIRQALDYRANFNLDSAASRSDLMNFPEVWLSFHILFSDKELAAFLSRTGGNSKAQQ